MLYVLVFRGDYAVLISHTAVAVVVAAVYAVTPRPTTFDPRSNAAPLVHSRRRRQRAGVVVGLCLRNRTGMNW